MIDELGGMIVAEEAKKSGFNTKKVLILVLVFGLFLVVTVGVAYMVAVKVVVDENKTENPKNSEVEERGILVSGGEFTTNLKDKGIIKITLEYEVENEKVKEEVEEKSPIIKDKVISVLRSQKYDEVNGYMGMENLRSSIKQELNKILQKGKLMEVYITDIIVF